MLSFRVLLDFSPLDHLFQSDPDFFCISCFSPGKSKSVSGICTPSSFVNTEVKKFIYFLAVSPSSVNKLSFLYLCGLTNHFSDLLFFRGFKRQLIIIYHDLIGNRSLFSLLILGCIFVFLTSSCNHASLLLYNT